MKVNLLLVRPGGTFRRQKGTLTKDFPDHLINHRDNQAYPLCESPVFAVAAAYPLNTFEELVEAPEIPPVLTPEKYMAVAEDGGVWPYSPKLIQTADAMVVRQRKRMDWQEEGRQYAENQSITKSLDNGLLTFGGIAAVMVFCLFALLTALIVAQYKFAPKAEEVAPAVAVLSLLGVTIAGRPGAGAPALPAPGAVLTRRERSARQRLAQRISVYLYDSIDYRIKHYSLPFSEVVEHLGTDSMYFPDVIRYRQMGLMLPLLVGLVAFGALWELMGSAGIPLIFMAEMLLVPLSALVGWWKGPMLMLALAPTMRPFCVARRGMVDGQVEISAVCEGEEVLVAQGEAQTVPGVMPLRHTHGNGVDPEIHEAIISGLLEEAVENAREQGLPVLPEYRPIVNRARDVYEDLMAHLEREDTRIKNTTQEKLTIGSLVVMAFASAGVLFFVAIATA